MRQSLKLILLFLFTFTMTGCDLFNPSPDDETDTPIVDTEDDIKIVLNTGQDTVEIDTEWTDAGATITINGREYTMDLLEGIDITTLGIKEVSYTYTYNDTDYDITRYVIVVDQTAPVIELNVGVDTISVGNDWEDAGVVITDNSGETITPVIEGSVDTSTPGTYEITYIATDSSDNESRITRYVTVIE